MALEINAREAEEHHGPRRWFGSAGREAGRCELQGCSEAGDVACGAFIDQVPVKLAERIDKRPQRRQGSGGVRIRWVCVLVDPADQPRPAQDRREIGGGRGDGTVAAERAKVERLLRAAFVELDKAAYQEQRLVGKQADWVDRPVALAR